jgi:hypothetical protein
MNALFGLPAKRYVASIYSPQFLQRLIALFSAKKSLWRGSENRATLGVNGCQSGIESSHYFPIGK